MVIDDLYVYCTLIVSSQQPDRRNKRSRFKHMTIYAGSHMIKLQVEILSLVRTMYN